MNEIKAELQKLNLEIIQYKAELQKQKADSDTGTEAGPAPPIKSEMGTETTETLPLYVPAIAETHKVASKKGARGADRQVHTWTYSVGNSKIEFVQEKRGWTYTVYTDDVAVPNQINVATTRPAQELFSAIARQNLTRTNITQHREAHRELLLSFLGQAGVDVPDETKSVIQHGQGLAGSQTATNESKGIYYIKMLGKQVRVSRPLYKVITEPKLYSPSILVAQSDIQLYRAIRLAEEGRIGVPEGDKLPDKFPITYGTGKYDLAVKNHNKWFPFGNAFINKDALKDYMLLNVYHSERQEVLYDMKKVGSGVAYLINKKGTIDTNNFNDDDLSCYNELCARCGVKPPRSNSIKHEVMKANSYTNGTSKGRGKEGALVIYKDAKELLMMLKDKMIMRNQGNGSMILKNQIVSIANKLLQLGALKPNNHDRIIKSMDSTAIRPKKVKNI